VPGSGFDQGVGGFFYCPESMEKCSVFVCFRYMEPSGTLSSTLGVSLSLQRCLLETFYGVLGCLVTLWVAKYGVQITTYRVQVAACTI